MGYSGNAKTRVLEVWEGESEESLDDALRAAVDASGVEPGTTLVVTNIEIVTIDDPNIGSYKVTVKVPGGS